MTSTLRLSLNIKDHEDVDYTRPKVTIEAVLPGLSLGAAEVAVDAEGFLPIAEGAADLAEMLEDVAAAIRTQLADAHTREQDKRKSDVVEELVKTGLTQAQAEAAAETTLRLIASGSAEMQQKVFDTPITDSGRVSFVAHEPTLEQRAARMHTLPEDVPFSAYAAEHDRLTSTGMTADEAKAAMRRRGFVAPGGGPSYPTPQPVLDKRAARKEARDEDKRARFNPKPSGGQR